MSINQNEAQKSIEFFKSIGYLEFTGKFQPFEIPVGSHIGEIKETGEGLQITCLIVSVCRILASIGNWSLIA